MKIETLIFNARYNKRNMDNIVEKNPEKFDDYQLFTDMSDNFFKKEDWNAAKNKMEFDLMECIKSLTKDIFKGFGPKIAVRQNEYLKWKDLTNDYGEDLFTCCHMALNKRKLLSINDFKWKQSLQTNNKQFKKIINDVCENHFHLKGSFPIVDLNISLLASKKEISSFFDLSNNKGRAEYRDAFSRKELLELEICSYRLMALRAYLFNTINNNNKREWTKKDFFTDEDFVNIIYQNEIFCTSNVVLNNTRYDYSLSLVIDAQKELQEQSLLIYGERIFLYNCFYYYNNVNKIGNVMRELLPLYITLKNQFYSFFIQNNSIVGFTNFNIYEKRKDFFIDKEFKKYIPVLSYSYANETNGLQNLEFRITPKQLFKDMHNDLTKICLAIDEKRKNTYKNKIYGSDYSIVYHLIKTSENESNRYIKPRNYDLRCKLYNQVRTVNNIYNRNNKYTNKIVGIDCANTEVKCRPEVFASSYRFLRNNKACNTGYNRLKYTYHVGEDFSDILDGLRAIYEAVYFLQMEENDRLGHCIALGIDCTTYYDRKNRNVVKRRLDYVDDLCFLKWCCEINQIRFPNSLEKKIISEMHELLQNKYYTIDDYIESMFLRGDIPYKMRNKFIKFFDDDGNSAFSLLIKKARNNVNAIDIYERYHYDRHFRNKGNETIIYIATDKYIDLVEKTQDFVKSILETKKIWIESNPTSNYLIGPVKNYCEIPLFKLFPLNTNNYVCINTDDEGVFSTSLYNEYSFIYSILIYQKKKMNVSYSKIDILNYLDTLKNNSIKCKF